MKIAIGTKKFATIAGHAGRTRDWLMFDTISDKVIFPPRAISLRKAELIHHFGKTGKGPHPLDGAEVIVTGSAGEGFVRHMAKRGARVVMTGEDDPQEAVRKLLAGEPLAATRFDITTMLCKVHDLFSTH